MPQSSFPPACPHGPIEPIADGVFMVRGGMQMNPVVRITRNMAIVKEGDILTLINPIRLSEAGLKALDGLGEVKHLLRLGAFHGFDDPFYIDRYHPTFWVQSGGEAYPEPTPDQILSEGGPLPFGKGEILCLGGVKQPECLLRLDVGKGLLLTCDVIQNYDDYSHNNIPAKLAMPFLGFKKTTLVGPIWLRLMPEDKEMVKADLMRLLDWDFDALLSAHGTFLASGAKPRVKAAIDKAFAD